MVGFFDNLFWWDSPDVSRSESLDADRQGLVCTQLEENFGGIVRTFREAKVWMQTGKASSALSWKKILVG